MTFSIAISLLLIPSSFDKMSQWFCIWTKQSFPICTNFLATSLTNIGFEIKLRTAIDILVNTMKTMLIPSIEPWKQTVFLILIVWTIFAKETQELPVKWYINLSLQNHSMKMKNILVNLLIFLKMFVTYVFYISHQRKCA